MIVRRSPLISLQSSAYAGQCELPPMRTIGTFVFRKAQQSIAWFFAASIRPAWSTNGPLIPVCRRNGSGSPSRNSFGSTPCVRLYIDCHTSADRFGLPSIPANCWGVDHQLFSRFPTSSIHVSPYVPPPFASRVPSFRQMLSFRVLNCSSSCCTLFSPSFIAFCNNPNVPLLPHSAFAILIQIGDTTTGLRAALHVSTC